MASILIHSAPTEQALIKSTASYYGGATIILQGTDWPKSVHNANGEIRGIFADRVQCGPGRYRFHLRRKCEPCKSHGLEE